MPVISTAKMTARQFLMLGDDPPGVRLELVNGEIAVSPRPRPKHSHIEKRLSRILLNHIIPRDLGELVGDVDTIFGEFDVRRPDLIYFTKARSHLLDYDNAIENPPGLCIEILSPSSGSIDRKDKFKQYAAAGVEHYWIVDPEARTIEAYRLSGRRYKLIGKGAGNDIVRLAPFADLAIPLEEIWVPATPA